MGFNIKNNYGPNIEVNDGGRLTLVQGKDGMWHTADVEEAEYEEVEDSKGDNKKDPEPTFDRKNENGTSASLDASRQEIQKQLEKGRGDRVKIVWQNLIGYFVDRKLLPSTIGAPALNKMFFGDDNGYTNIDKGRPSKGLMTADFKSLVPLLDDYLPRVDKKA